MIATPHTNDPWSPFIEKQVKNTFYYDPRWFELIRELYGYRVFPLTTTNPEGQITGFLPVCLVSSPLTGRRLVSLPFSDHCPLLATDEASANALIDQAIHLAQQERVKYLELRTGVNNALSKSTHLTESNLYVNWTLPLSENPQDLWKRLPKPVQRQIKKSQQLGVHIRTAHKRQDIALYHNLHLRTRTKKHGMPAQSKHYFLHLWDTFAPGGPPLPLPPSQGQGSGSPPQAQVYRPQGTLQLLLAEYQEKTIAAIILLASGNTVHYAYGASDERHLNLAPNNLLFWHAITWASTQGYTSFDLGRTAHHNEGLMEFKRRWGAIKEPLPYYYYPHTAGLAATSERSWKYRLLTNTWRKLPLAIAAPLGAHLYKHLG